MPDLAIVLSEVRARIERYRGTAMKEENTKATLIEPVLRALGWNPEDLEEVCHEYRRVPNDNPVDYALLILRTPRLFVEAKPLDTHLDDPHWANQIMGYAAVSGVQWVVLTNGDEYRLYNSHAPVPIEGKLFRLARLSDENTRAEDLLELIAKERMRENLLDALWKAHFIDRQLRAAIDGLFSGDAEPTLVRLIAKRVSALSHADIKAGLTRARIHLDFPIEPLAAGSTRAAGLRLVEQGAKRDSSSQPDTRRRHTPRDNTTVMDLIKAGLIHPPLDLEKDYLRRHLAARVETDGRVSCLGQTYDSLSTAGGAARASAPGAPADRKFPQTNGWTFWHFRDGNGHLRPVDELRQAYRLRSKATGA